MVAGVAKTWDRAPNSGESGYIVAKTKGVICDPRNIAYVDIWAQLLKPRLVNLTVITYHYLLECELWWFWVSWVDLFGWCKLFVW